MKEYCHKSENMSRTINSSEVRKSNQPSLHEILCSNRKNVTQCYGDIALNPGLNPSTEEEVIAATGDSEVILMRGIEPVHRQFRTSDSVITGSFVSFSDMLSAEDKISNTETTAPGTEETQKYVTTVDDTGPKNLIEFTTAYEIAKTFASQSSIGYILYVKIAKKYLQKAEASGAEFGWMAKQDAPYQVIATHKIENSATKLTFTRLNEAQIMEAKKEEQDAIMYRRLKSLMTSGESLTSEQKLDFVRIQKAYYDAKRQEEAAICPYTK